MKHLAVFLSCMLALEVPNAIADEKDRVTKQKQLDEVCEAARKEKIAHLRPQFVEECVEKRKKDREYCERFYRDYGARSGNRPPLFYDLPECVKAFEYRRSYRE